MQELIRQAFLHVNRIGQRVAEGHYDLIGPNGEIILPKVWETTIEPGWSISMHMWPMPEPSRPHIGHWRNPGPPPPPPPMPESPGAALPSRARPVSPPAIVHLTRGPPRSRHSKSKARGWMRKANKLFSTKDRDGKLNLSILLPALFEIANKMRK
jgi:hypothetical protein